MSQHSEHSYIGHKHSVSQNNLTMASKPSHQLSMNFWLNTLVDIKKKKN